jgi:hypothetical protein
LRVADSATCVRTASPTPPLHEPAKGGFQGVSRASRGKQSIQRCLLGSDAVEPANHSLRLERGRLLEAKADPTAKEWHKKTPLDVAKESKHPDVVKLLESVK